MEGNKRNRNTRQRQQRYIEEPWDDETEPSSSLALALEDRRTDKSPIHRHHMATEESAGHERYSQWQTGYTMSQGVPGTHNNMPVPCGVYPYAAPPAMNWTYFPFHPPRGQFTGQYQSGYFAQNVAPGAPTENAAAVYQEYSPRPPRHDFWLKEFGIPGEDLVYRRGKFEHDTFADFELTQMPPVVWRGISHRTFAHSQTYRPPQNNMGTLAGRYSRYSAKSSILRKPSTKPHAPRPATKRDARLHKIPTNYILDQWDPDENPIIFCHNVFDVNSLGKWIFDWTAWSYEGKECPMAAIAGDLWLLLIHLTGKLKLSGEFVQECARRTSEELYQAEMVSHFIATGEHLMQKLQAFLTKCEGPVLRALDEETEIGGLLVEIMFDRRNQLIQTERFIQSIRSWNLRWDTNCATIVGYDSEKPLVG